MALSSQGTWAPRRATKEKKGSGPAWTRVFQAQSKRTGEISFFLKLMKFILPFKKLSFSYLFILTS